MFETLIFESLLKFSTVMIFASWLVLIIAVAYGLYRLVYRMYLSLVFHVNERKLVSAHLALMQSHEELTREFNTVFRMRNSYRVKYKELLAKVELEKAHEPIIDPTGSEDSEVANAAQ